MGRIIRPDDTSISYNKQSLPKIGFWTGYNGTGLTTNPSAYGLNAYDSDLQSISSTVNTNFAGLTTEIGTAVATYMNTGQPVATGTGAPGVGGGVKGCNASGYDGHMVFAGAVDGSYSFRSYSLMSSAYASYGTIVGPEGYRANISLWSNNQTLRQYASGPPLLLDTFPVDGTVATLAGVTNLGQGLVSYNRNLNTLIWMEPKDTAGTSYRVHYWKNPRVKLTGRPGQLRNFITGAYPLNYKYVDFTWPNGLPVATSTEANYRGKIFLCNNGAVAITRMVPNRGQDMGVISPAGVFTARSLASQVTAQGTNYGVEQGNAFGIRHNISWDNKWAVTYNPYYYYCCGIIGYVFNLDDPTIQYNYTNPSTTDGTQIQPFGRSGFILCDSTVNAAAVGPTIAFLDVSSGYLPNGTQLTPQQPLTLTFQNGVADTAGTTTNYPCLVPMERWAAPGVINGQPS